jgi:hypothetical protein
MSFDLSHSDFPAALRQFYSDKRIAEPDSVSIPSDEDITQSAQQIYEQFIQSQDPIDDEFQAFFIAFIKGKPTGAPQPVEAVVIASADVKDAESEEPKVEVQAVVAIADSENLPAEDPVLKRSAHPFRHDVQRNHQRMERLVLESDPWWRTDKHPPRPVERQTRRRR